MGLHVEVGKFFPAWDFGRFVNKRDPASLDGRAPQKKTKRTLGRSRSFFIENIGKVPGGLVLSDNLNFGTRNNNRRDDDLFLAQYRGDENTQAGLGDMDKRGCRVVFLIDGDVI